MTWKSGVARRWEAEERAARNLNHHQMKWLNEFLLDAEKSPRLSAWDRDFVAGIWGRYAEFGAAVRISEAQWVQFRRIEEKIHAAG